MFVLALEVSRGKEQKSYADRDARFLAFVQFDIRHFKVESYFVGFENPEKGENN